MPVSWFSIDYWVTFSLALTPVTDSATWQNGPEQFLLFVLRAEKCIHHLLVIIYFFEHNSLKTMLYSNIYTKFTFNLTYSRTVRISVCMAFCKAVFVTCVCVCVCSVSYFYRYWFLCLNLLLIRMLCFCLEFKYPFTDEAQTALFKDPVRTAL